MRGIALSYVGRYATTRAKLRTYLARKIQERGWQGDARPDLEALAEDFAALGYVDDRAFATARGAALTRRGYGERRIGQALQQAGIVAEDALPVREEAREQGFDAALRLARKRRIGPFATGTITPQDQQRGIAALVRAGHDFATARRIATARTPEELNEDG
nr:RecX family transcriptional regulator [Sphingomonas vulcanisoli]